MPSTGTFGMEPLEKRLLLSATPGADIADAWTAEPEPIAAILEEAVPEGPQAALPDHQPAIDLFDNLPTLFEAGPQPAAPTVLALPTDPLFGDQWHLDNTGQSGGTIGVDLNIVEVWDTGIKGSGIVIGIVDDAIDTEHPDLPTAVLAKDFVGDDDTAWPDIGTQGHGTAVAGIALARDDGTNGVVGVAPEADLAALKVVFFSSPIPDAPVAEALEWQQDEIHIYNNSWGPSATLEKMGPLTKAAIKKGITEGRDGLGNIYVRSAGNDQAAGDNVNYDGFANSIYTIAVAAVDHDGEQTTSSEPGAPILVSAFSGINVLFRTLPQTLQGWEPFDDGWGFGQSDGGGTGNRDPPSTPEHLKFVGYNLGDDYENDIGAPVYATTQTFNATTATELYVSFDRWLGVGPPAEDTVSVEVKSDSFDWTPVWTNADESTEAIEDRQWTRQTVRLHNVGEGVDAAGDTNVQIRWGVGPTNASGTYPGWNIDNVVVLAKESAGPSGIVTTDVNELQEGSRKTEAGYNFDTLPDAESPALDKAYTETFSGTSAAAPMVSGVVALMLNKADAIGKELTWRDVQHILVRSATMNDAADTAKWDTNGAGHDISYEYGFGLVNAGAAVDMVATWDPAEYADYDTFSTGTMSVHETVPDNDPTGLTKTTDEFDDENKVKDSMTLEWVEVRFHAPGGDPGDLTVELTSPAGTSSILANPYDNTLKDGGDYSQWTFTTARHWDEDTVGTWSLKVSDEETGETVDLVEWELTFHGTNYVPHKAVDETIPESILRAIEAIGPDVTGVTIITHGFEPSDDG
ncbi:MAG: S8 family serine peptidase, partial [Lentisphaeria bacterium]|nr:S8 family serine peptidase [Lentisphaeria bacterium]